MWIFFYYLCRRKYINYKLCFSETSEYLIVSYVFFQVTTPDGDEYLVSMPTKFRKNIWVKRGDYILVEPILEGDKVKGEIVKIMNKDSIKYYKENKVWPIQFDDNKADTKTDDDDLFVNTNRNHVTICDNESDSSDSSDDDSAKTSDGSEGGGGGGK